MLIPFHLASGDRPTLILEGLKHCSINADETIPQLKHG